MTDNKTLRAARTYVARGLAVFPLNGKIPVTDHGCDDATLDVTQIETWFRHVRNIAIRTPPGVVVVDVDPRNGGDRTLSEWCAEHGVEWLADVPRARTGGGGTHYWFRYDGQPLKKAIGGIDFQRGNKYVVAPPSITAAEYRWEIILPHDLADLPDLPDWLLELAHKPPVTDTMPVGDMTFDDGDPLDAAARHVTSLRGLLERHGWILVAGDGNSDGSKWRHPASDNPFSATVKYGCLFVYSPNTPFPVTEDSDPHGITLFAAIETLDYGGDRHAFIQALRDAGHLETLRTANPTELLATAPPSTNGSAPTVELVDSEDVELKLGGYLNWPEAFAADEDIEQRWLVEPIVAIGRAHALYAGAKTGKSLLMLALAAALASGRPFLDLPAHDPTPVLYCDYEMTRDDVVDRVQSFGYQPDQLEHLHYALLSSGNGLDTPSGGFDLTHDARALGVGLVIVDTTARAVAGAENDADTLRAFYRHTGAPLKRLGISVIRLDHAGKDATKGQRGTSAKNDDVDIVWKLTVADDGAFDLEATHQRMGWVERKVALELVEDEETGVTAWARRGSQSYPPGAKETAERLDELGAPPGISAREAQKLLRGHDWKGRTTIVVSALQWRREARAKYLFEGRRP